MIVTIMLTVKGNGLFIQPRVQTTAVTVTVLKHCSLCLNRFPPCVTVSQRVLYSSSIFSSTLMLLIVELDKRGWY